MTREKAIDQRRLKVSRGVSVADIPVVVIKTL
jgi:hypothetical protein